jgi:predicted DNA-binding protein
MTETLTIRIAEELASALTEEARRTGLSKGEIARQAIEERLRKAGKLLVMERHIGSMSGPVDLSTNKSYRKTWKKKRRA